MQPKGEAKTLTPALLKKAEAHLSQIDRAMAKLIRTRDLLLARLISCEVGVSELDITVPEEAPC